jgi:nitrogen regulatory protein P-II 1
VKKIEAIIKPFKLEAIKLALLEKNIEGMTISDVVGYGQRGHKERYRGNEYIVDLVAKKKIEIIVSNDKYLNEVIDIIKKNAYTGEIGDGKIFIYDIEKVIRIRTLEEDEEALK